MNLIGISSSGTKPDSRIRFLATSSTLICSPMSSTNVARSCAKTAACSTSWAASGISMK